jgi:predicted AlkP superfamily phosphohydrolase/phosphomutase
LYPLILIKDGRMAKQKPLYLIGIDSAPLWVLQKLKNSEGMEAFSKLLDDGAIHNLESTLLPVTAASWPTIYTGLQPPKHGVPEFLVITKDYVPDVTFFDTKKSEPFYYKLARSGFKCLVITPAMDVTLPPKDVDKNLDIITGFPLPPKTNKVHLKQAMNRFEFRGEPEIDQKIQRGELGKDKAVAAYTDAINRRAHVAEDLMADEDYDLVYVCFTETDRIQHFFLNDDEEEKYLLPLYSAISRYISYVLKLIEKDNGTLMIVSDHGAQKVEQEFLINSWMVSKGYAKLRYNEEPKSATKAPAKKGMRQNLREAIFKSRLRDLYERVPYHAKKVAFSIFATFLPAAEEEGYTRVLLTDFDMSKTRAFGAISVLPVSSIWINDSRFRNGIVKNSDVPKVKREIIEALKRIKDKKGTNLITKIVDGREYYGNKTSFIPPDIIFEVSKNYNIDPYHISSTSSIFMEPREVSITNHTSYGIFGFYPKGKDKPKKANVSVADIHDIILKHFTG